MTPTMTYRNLAAAATGKTATTDPCTPCPACGGLECLCRPRFFAGQLLTEADLNRLDHYIVAKNKLHNRYVHGWGVACGMEVLCRACGAQVVVRAGYGRLVWGRLDDSVKVVPPPLVSLEVPARWPSRWVSRTSPAPPESPSARCRT